jgi:nicotinate-nucleotide pyrophosphorylase (carboxylating)
MNYSIAQLTHFLTAALAEDIGTGDHTSLSTIPKGEQSQAKLLVKEDGIIAGVQIALKIFELVDPNLQIELFYQDGDTVKVGQEMLHVKGSVHSILKAERLVLNTMQRMSGIATTTAHAVSLVKDYQTQILDTRKTTPGFRFLEKEAVKIGGGVNHRFGLFDMILIKDNHVDYAGGITKALENAQQYLLQTGLNLPIEIETRTLAEVKEALAIGGFQRIMFDNFTFENMKAAVNLVDGKYETEASGGITIENVQAYAACGVSHISLGALTHSVKSLDLSLKAF